MRKSQATHMYIIRLNLGGCSTKVPGIKSSSRGPQLHSATVTLHQLFSTQYLVPAKAFSSIHVVA